MIITFPGLITLQLDLEGAEILYAVLEQDEKITAQTSDGWGPTHPLEYHTKRNWMIASRALPNFADKSIFLGGFASPTSSKPLRYSDPEKNMYEVYCEACDALDEWANSERFKKYWSPEFVLSQLSLF